MRLYHRSFFLLLVLLAWLPGCRAVSQTAPGLIRVNLHADGQTLTVELPPGSTVQTALEKAHLTLNALDRTQPAAYTMLSAAADVDLIRVTEAFEVEQVTLPFEQQTLRNESLPVEQEMLLQAGQNGLQEITYRRVFEDGVEVSREPVPVNSVILKEPLPEIRMIGVQLPFAPLAIAGKLYYLRDGSLWLMEGSTSSRRAVLPLGDLDGRIVSISQDGQWALVTRRASVVGRINNLWVAYIGAGEMAEDKRLIDLNVANVLYFADWAPNSTTKIFFSTVEPRPTAPGWQANNDLQSLTFANTGWTTKWVTLVDTNSGGVYGWWGTDFQWAPDGKQLAYHRPDGVGLVDIKTGAMTNTLEITPLQTFRDWAWAPGLTWGPDGKALYVVNHAAPNGAVAPEESPNFNIDALLLSGGQALPMATQTGMFAYPLASPMQEQSGGPDYQIAYLQAQFPERSETSRYRLAVMDRDGSNRQLLFPPAESAGLAPQLHWGAWSPTRMPDTQNYAIALIYEGNLWLVDTVSGQAVQVTGDGLTTRILWK